MDTNNSRPAWKRYRVTAEDGHDHGIVVARTKAGAWAEAWATVFDSVEDISCTRGEFRRIYTVAHEGRAQCQACGDTGRVNRTRVYTGDACGCGQ